MLSSLCFLSSFYFLYLQDAIGSSVCSLALPKNQQFLQESWSALIGELYQKERSGCSLTPSQGSLKNAKWDASLFPWNKVCTHCRSYLALGHLFSLVLSHRAAVLSPFLLIRQTLDSLWSSLVFAWWTPGPREMPLDSRRYLPCSPWSSSLSKASGTWQGWTARWGESDDL